MKVILRNQVLKIVPCKTCLSKLILVVFGKMLVSSLVVFGFLYFLDSQAVMDFILTLRREKNVMCALGAVKLVPQLRNPAGGTKNMTTLKAGE